MDADKIRDAGGPAFPLRGADYGSEGMTLRDYFAAAALSLWVGSAAEDSAKAAYATADAMLAERSK